MPGSMHGIVWKCGKIRDGCSEMIIKSVLRRTLTPFLKGRFYTFSSLLPGHLSKVVLPRPHCRLNTRLPKAIPVKGVSTDAEGASTNVRLADNAETRELEPGLYVVATPIGNLEDITLRALRVLKSASIILAEDTRHSQKLLSFYGIQTRTVSFHEHNEREKESKVMDLLKNGQAIALISDAGMPLISDPGSVIVRKATENDIRVVPIPGPSAILSALVASGLPTSQFHFYGFLPPKQVARQKAIHALTDNVATLIFFVSPHSLVSVLSDLAAILGGNRKCVTARELTKVYEEFYRGSLEDTLAEFESRNPKGEITLIVEGCDLHGLSSSTSLTDAHIQEQLQNLLNEGWSSSSAAKKLSKDLDLPKNRVYDLATQLKLKEEGSSWPD